MSSPNIPVLGASTANRQWLHEFKVDGAYLVCGGVMTSKFEPSTATWVDNTDQAGKGAMSSNKIGYTWTSTLQVDRKRGKTDPTTYDVVQEFLRLAALNIGAANTVEVRVFEYDANDPSGLTTPRIEAYHGFCGVDYLPDGGNMMADNTATVTLHGQGALDLISHPYPANPVAPTVATITPAFLAVAGGTPFRLLGEKFTGTTAVTIGGTAVTSFTAWSDGEITGVAEAHVAGSNLPVIVTNAVGASAAADIATFA